MFLSTLEQKNYVLKNTLRQDLKSQSGWDYKKVQKYALPPIVNLCQPLFITEIIQAINNLSWQKNQTLPKTGEFFLKKAMPSLRDRMYMPEEEVWVAIVSDKPAEITGIKKILENWPNVNYGYFMESKMKYVIDEIILLKAKVILFDGGIWTKLYEEEILNLLQEKRFDGIFATINDGEHPEWSKWHFESKHKIEDNLSVSKKFVSFINNLLKRID